MSTTIYQVLGLIQTHMEEAEKKFKPFNSLHEGMSIIREEVDELWDAVKANDVAKALEEASHIGAMAARFIKDTMNNPNPLSRRSLP